MPVTYKLLNCYLCSVGSASYKCVRSIASYKCVRSSASYKCVRSSASYKCVHRFSLRRKVYGSLFASHFGPKQKLRDPIFVHFMHLVSILMLEAKPATEALVFDPTLTLPVSRENLSSFHYVPCLVRVSVRIKWAAENEHVLQFSRNAPFLTAWRFVEANKVSYWIC
jgi:hypothetical protein